MGESVAVGMVLVQRSGARADGQKMVSDECSMVNDDCIEESEHQGCIS